MPSDSAAKKYLDNLITTLQILIRDNRVSTSPYAGEYLRTLSDSLQALEHNKRQGRKSWAANFKLLIPLEDINLCGEIGETFLFLGTDIICDDQERIRQSIGAWLVYNPADEIGNNRNGITPLSKDDYTVFRKFHFDYDMTLADKPDCHWPWAHLQYGGKCQHELLPPTWKVQYNLFSTLDFPRIPFPPYDFNLAFDLFCRQFPSIISDLTQERSWISVLKNSEKLWLKKYFEGISSYFDQTRNETLYEYSRSINPLA